MHPDRMIIQKYTCTPMFIVALFMITRYRSNLNEWIKKMCYVYIQWNTAAAAAAAAAAKSLPLCLTLCDPTDGSPPGSPIPGIFQARTLEWVAIAFSDNGILLGHKKDKIVPFAATWLQIEIIILSDVNQIEQD